MVKAVIFDFDGVLCQTEQYILERKVSYFKELGLDVTKKMLIPLAGGTRFDREKMYDDIFGNQKRYYEVKNLMLEHRSQPSNIRELRTEGIVPLLEELILRGVRIAVASNSSKERLERVLKECEINQFVELQVVPIDDKRKPDPFVYHETLKLMNLSSEDCLVVEDSFVGIRAAKLAGLRVLALRDKEGYIDQSEADVIITNIAQVLDYLY